MATGLWLIADTRHAECLIINSKGHRESGAVRPVANLIRLRKAHRGSRELWLK
ncbi:MULTISPECIES: hypothetical protein [unclassified Moorena]|uniref:hypothetical protein n=1 Tax=unclassified Moorena TaxID=2683338 RepID=UPI0014010A79|nr:MULTISPECIES: hypothetical protein [unclassified Moorena]NEO12059.1 hypothetical protein [Moorena sp. SIO3E8]NEQ03481.1 hypothetical protein [Moorena sp. SIO3F7]